MITKLRRTNAWPTSRAFFRFLTSRSSKAALRTGSVCASVLLAASSPVAAREPSPDVQPSLQGSCSAAALSLEDAYESVQVGGRALASDTVLGGPPQCVGTAFTKSPNVRVTVQKKGNAASVRIWALHEGFAYVTVTAASGVEIGVVRVSVYPREPRAHKGGK